MTRPAGRVRRRSKSHGSGPVGSAGFQISRVGPCRPGFGPGIPGPTRPDSTRQVDLTLEQPWWLFNWRWVFCISAVLNPTDGKYLHRVPWYILFFSGYISPLISCVEVVSLDMYRLFWPKPTGFDNRRRRSWTVCEGPVLRERKKKREKKCFLN